MKKKFENSSKKSSENFSFLKSLFDKKNSIALNKCFSQKKNKQNTQIARIDS
jgi:hypothetical protein